jgi:hypothetical protein
VVVTDAVVVGIGDVAGDLGAVEERRAAECDRQRRVTGRLELLRLSDGGTRDDGDRRRRAVAGRRAADGAAGAEVDRCGDSLPCVTAESEPCAGPLPATTLKVSETPVGASASSSTTTSTSLAVSAVTSRAATVVSGGSGVVGSPFGLIRTEAMPTCPTVSVTANTKLSSTLSAVAGE